MTSPVAPRHTALPTTAARRPRVNPALLVVALALALVASWLAPVAGIAPATPALAAATDLTLVTDTTYTVQPDQGRVRVAMSIVARNNTKETRTRRFFFDHAFLAVLPGVSSVKISGGGSRVRISKRSSQSTLLRIDFGSRLYSGKARTFKLSFTIADPGKPATRALRVGPSLVTLPVWAHATNGAKGSTVKVRFPAGYEVFVESGSFARQTATDGGGTELATGKLASPLKFFAYVSAQKPAVFEDVPLTIGAGEDEVSLTLRGWQDDPGWVTRVGGLFERSIPALRDEIGLPWPHDEPMVIQEAVSRTAGGYAGLFEPAENRIEVAYWADHLVVIHEAAHGWFNGSLLADRWANEGFASLYAERVAATLEEKGTSPELTEELQAARIPLNAWAAQPPPEVPEQPGEPEQPDASAAPSEMPAPSETSVPEQSGGPASSPTADPSPTVAPSSTTAPSPTPAAAPSETPAPSEPAASPEEPAASPDEAGVSPEEPAAPDPATEAYGFAASRALASLIAERAGDEALRGVWSDAASGIGAYQPGAPGATAASTGATGDGAPETVAGPPDWRGLLDLLEARTGKDFTDLWREWVVRPEEVALLDARAEAQASYTRTLALAGDWTLPASIRDALRGWQFETAEQLMSDARTVLAQRAAVVEMARRDGLTLPDKMRTSFEAGDLVVASGQAEAERNAMIAIGQAEDARSADRDILTTIGMVGEDPEADLAAARAGLATGDVETTLGAADDAFRAWSGAWQEGRRRALLAVAVLATLIVLLSAVLGRVRTGRRERAALAGGGTLSDTAGPGETDQADRTHTTNPTDTAEVANTAAARDDRPAPPPASG